MRLWSLRKKKKPAEEKSFWKEDFSDCKARDYLPDYSICKSRDSGKCRYLSIYGNVFLCSHPEHKSFIPPGSEPFDPHKNLI